VQCRQLVEPAPQVHVLDRLPVRGAPAALFPVADPRADAELHVLRVGVEPSPGAVLERFQGADHGDELHAVVRGMRFSAVKFARPAVTHEQHAPAAGTGIALARAVGIDFDGTIHC
jgi:hypothetical protein